jgi:hypothetical protein
MSPVTSIALTAAIVFTSVGSAIFASPPKIVNDIYYLVQLL